MTYSTTWSAIPRKLGTDHPVQGALPDIRLRVAANTMDEAEQKVARLYTKIERVKDKVEHELFGLHLSFLAWEELNSQTTIGVLVLDEHDSATTEDIIAVSRRLQPPAHQFHLYQRKSPTPRFLSRKGLTGVILVLAALGTWLSPLGTLFINYENLIINRTSKISARDQPTNTPDIAMSSRTPAANAAGAMLPTAATPPVDLPKPLDTPTRTQPNSPAPIPGPSGSPEDEIQTQFTSQLATHPIARQRLGAVRLIIMPGLSYGERASGVWHCSIEGRVVSAEGDTVLLPQKFEAVERGTRAAACNNAVGQFITRLLLKVEN